ncbi:MAG: metallophosphoesterase [Acetobacteraceae bacterium]|nr:metallophosphoesterase [Acetobacteraceae bacterium]
MTAGPLIAHSSDLHIDEDRSVGSHDGTAGLRDVLATAYAAGADLLLLAGDTFDNNRVGARTLERTAEMLLRAPMPIVLLPGNHDPALAGSVFHRGGLGEIAGVSVLGLTHAEAVTFPEHGLEIWGHAHLDYEDMPPLRGPRPRTTRWQVAMAHGHFEWRRDRANPLRPSWLFSEDDIEATAADYLALGHWDRAAAVGDGRVPAYYSGSPGLAGTINLIRLGVDAGVGVSRRDIARG